MSSLLVSSGDSVVTECAASSVVPGGRFLFQPHALSVKEQVVTVEGFDEIVVGVGEGYVDFTIVRYGTYAVHEDEVGVLAQFCAVVGAAQRVEDVFGGIEILLAFLSFDIGAQFEEG